MILVYAETFEGKISDITYELLRKARELGDEVWTVVIGKAELEGLGASDKVIHVDDERFNNPALHRYVLKKIVEMYKPKKILIGNTPIGIDLALGILPTLVSCVDLDSKARAVSYGGKVFVEVEFEGIYLINRGSFEPLKVDGEFEVERLSIDVEHEIELLDVVKPEIDVDITKADVVVGVGRGAQNIIDVAEELAEALGGVVGASRPLVDQGILPASRQIGRSGRTISPKLYLALGISGAMEHVEGVKAKNVIAINKDKKAPIFRISRYGVVGDVEEIVPLLLERLR